MVAVLSTGEEDVAMELSRTLLESTAGGSVLHDGIRTVPATASVWVVE